MPGSSPRPLGRPRLAPAGSNRPGGWAGYLLARNLLARAPPPIRHGNWRHGRRSAEGIAQRRHFRACMRALRGKRRYLTAIMALLQPPQMLGWLAFKGRGGGVAPPNENPAG